MRILFVTQSVDEEDPVLGFVCNWLRHFSARFSRIEVICLKEGTHHLPDNVRVHSLGKEKGAQPRFVYAWRFASLAWKLSKKYDAVFVHMNPEYILLAADLWRFTGKKVYLWYNHAVGSLALRLAAPFAKKIFHTSPFAYPARYRHACQMPVGIDTEIFKPQEVQKHRNHIYFQGRVARAKRVDVLLSALRIVRRKLTNATVTIVGPEEVTYGKELREEFKDLIAEGAAEFLGPRKNEETPALYSAHGVSVNLTASGNFDKTMLEGMACETPVVVSSRAFSEGIPEAFIVPEADAASLADALTRLITLPDDAYRELQRKEREAVVRLHSLDRLVARLYEEVSV